MKYEPIRHHRRSIRLKGYDYSQAGAYFVTICTHNRPCLFGEVADGKILLNEAGRIAEQCWLAIPDHFAHVELDAFVVMPNHVHGIIVIADPVGARHAVPLRNIAAPQPASFQSERFGKPIAGTIPTIVRSFKSAVAKRINEYRCTPGNPVWQRNYYEHIIRNEESLNRIRHYISENSKQWMFDRENPLSVTLEPEDAWCI